MVRDYPLYGGLPPHEHVDTSVEAALEIAPFVETLQEKVYRYISRQGKGGATSDEVEIALDLPHQTASARIRELVQLSRLVVTDTKRVTTHGRRARVAVCSEYAPPSDGPVFVQDELL